MRYGTVGGPSGLGGYKRCFSILVLTVYLVPGSNDGIIVMGLQGGLGGYD